MEKVEVPTREQVDALHARFCDALREFYDCHKKKYNNGEDIELAFE